MSRTLGGRRTRWALAATAALALTTGLTTTGAADAKSSDNLAAGVNTSNDHALLKHVGRNGSTPRFLAGKGAQGGEPGKATGLPAGVPAKGTYAFLLKLDTRSTSAAFAGARGAGVAAARTAAKTQLGSVNRAQNSVIAELPSKSKVLYRTHAVMAGVAVLTDVRNFDQLKGLHGVANVYPIAPKAPSNSYAVPLQGAPQAWKAYGDLGQNATVGIIDTGIDYTHADFGGEGTTAAFDAAKAQLGRDDADFPGTKVVGGYDLAGDAYQADPNSPDYDPTPAPDPYPLDCNSHGSHVAGTVGGYGENADGSTYTGAYNQNTPFNSMRIGPGMAPQAKLYAFRVFGCEGSTDLVSMAIDRAMDPNGDGDTSDHVDVVNMSLGSDYGSPEDGDSVMTQAASLAGITMVVASGNAGDLYDVGGSPGDASRSIAVAASVDASAQVDSLHVSAPGSIAGDYAAERSIAYDWNNSPDLSGNVVQVTDPTNLDGCDPLSSGDAAAVAGHIAFVEWTDDDTTRRCGSAARGANLAAAGASGFIYGNDEEHFAAGITGVDSIPGVLVAKSGADAIRAQLVAGTTVTISGTTANGFTQLDPTLNDTLASFSSRGIGDAGNVKPDVTAVGDSVFSAGSGTGNQGLNDSGTSMATPMVAGTAALVRSQHPDWNPEQTKADIMNTATQDVFTDPNHSGDKYAPQRVGAGRIEVKKALDNEVLAYNTTDPGSVSASFGPIAATGDMTLTKTIKVENTGDTARSYDVSYVPRTDVPGATYSLSDSTVSVDPRSSQTITLTLTIDASALTKTIDPTVDRAQGGLPRQYQADASGLVLLKGSGTPNLRVPVYAAPRPASVMTQPSSLTLPTSGVQEALLPLTGQAVNQGSGNKKVQSLVSGFELQATSGALPTCSGAVTTGCVDFADEASADLKYVGATSDAAQLTANGQDPSTDGLAYFAVSTQHPWRTASGIQEFDVLIDGDGDGVPDAVLFNTRLTSTDVQVSELVDLNSGEVVDIEAINSALGDTDTALFESDTMVLPVAIAAIPGVSSDASRIKYGVLAFSAYQSAPVDTAGVDSNGNFTTPLTFDVLHPGVSVVGSYDGSNSPLLFADSPASVLKVRKDSTAYAADGGKGIMMVHFQNAAGNKAQVVTLAGPAKTKSRVGLTVTPNPATHGKVITATVRVTKVGGVLPTGTVQLRKGTGALLGSGTLKSGVATIKFTVKAKSAFYVHATYAGDSHYTTGSSASVRLRVN